MGMVTDVVADIAHGANHLLPTELAHKIGVWGMKRGLFVPEQFFSESIETTLFGVDLPNPLGIAAGFDSGPHFARNVLVNYRAWKKLSS